MPTEEKKENRAEFYIYFHNYYGDLDSAMRFKRAPTVAPDGGIIKQGGTVEYTLVLTDKHLEFRPDAREPKEVTCAPEWRIEKPQPQVRPMVNLATAIRYVTEVRDKTKDPVVKKNADQTLAKLKKLH